MKAGYGRSYGVRSANSKLELQSPDIARSYAEHYAMQRYRYEKKSGVEKLGT